MLIMNTSVLSVYPSIYWSFDYDNNDCKERFGNLYWM